MFWMILDIFSSFDPYSFISLHSFTSLLLLSNICLLVIIQLSFWSIPPRYLVPWILCLVLIKEQLIRTFTSSLKGSTSIVSSLFTLIILINLSGLVPYTFRLSSHLIFTLCLGLPLWMSFISSSFTKSLKESIAHFLPDGAPGWLSPSLVLIETTRITVRPITLSFRLAANMRAGHIVLSLIGIYCSAAILTSLPASIILLITSLGYILFEVAICLIQAYIFCLLLSLYANDHAHSH